MLTYQDAAEKVGVTVPPHLEASAEVPILAGVQAQGDLLIVPTEIPAGVELLPVPDEGVQVVFGEATGNSHYLHRGFDSPGVLYARHTAGQTIAVVRIPAGESAQLIHTDEHGANGIAPGDYAINEKRELRDEIRRVTD